MRRAPAEFGSSSKRSRRRLLPLLVTTVLVGVLGAAPTYLGARAGQAWNAAPFALEAAAPAVLQQQFNDCGPAVVATLLEWAGRPTDLATVSAAAQLGPDGLSLGDFARLAHSFGFTGAWYRVEASDLATLGGPFVAHVRAATPTGPALGHLVVVWAAGRGAALVTDPAVGAYTVPLPELARRFTGRVYTLEGSV